MGARSRGMSLLEVMVAVCLLATVFLVVVATLPAVFDAQQDSERAELAASVAARVMERTRRQGYSQATSWSGEANLELTTGGARRVERFLYDVQVIEVETDLKDIVLKVAWDEDGTSRALVLQTRLSAGGAHP